MNTKTRRLSLMQLQISAPKQIVITAVIMFALILFVYYFKIPNPNMILIAGLVFCSAVFGFVGGIAAAVIMFFYTLFFFSTDNSFVRFTPENLQKVGVSLIGICVDMVLICLLKRAELQAFDEVDRLTERLYQENEQLKVMSLTDTLTGIQNRMALNENADAYAGHEVTVMVMDLDHFKFINDTYGHDGGDEILRKTGKLLTDTFGRLCCYRYGGDEFLVIVPDLSEEAFLDKLERIFQARPSLERDGETFLADYSVGYVHDTVKEQEGLAGLISKADQSMYRTKRGKAHLKNSGSGREKASAKKPAQIKEKEYSVDEFRAVLEDTSGQYDLVRVVDPIECCILELGSDGKISRKNHCYGIWNADQKCVNCSSAAACRTGCHHEKAEHFQNRVFNIESDPVSLTLPDGGKFNAVVERIRISEEKPDAEPANDRALENVDHMAVQYRAMHDHLTGVLNPDAFFEFCREKILKNVQLPWVMVTGNIMNFRLINTLFGVQKGNEVLVRTAEILKEIADKCEGLCGRIGGDHFAMLLPQSMYEEEMLEETAAALAEAFSTGIYTFRIHFGVYEMEDAAIPVSVMCDRANSALRTIRHALDMTVACFDDDMMQKSLFEQEIISSFEHALEDGQFRMYLQPQAGEDGRIFGAEALVRWHRPDGSILMPDGFIETLEQANLIHKLDMYMWECALKQLKLWDNTDQQAFTISVNMSTKDFYSIDVLQVLSALAGKYQVDSGRLMLEITETALLDDPEQADAVISNLRREGFPVEIDDFGKGNSSLQLLKIISAEVLKIDRSLVQEIAQQERSRIILKSIINMATSLGMQVVAEGVETEIQLQLLLEMGCRSFQGYYFSRPIPVEEFESKYERSSEQKL